MTTTVHCDIVSADESLFSGTVQRIVATGSLGDLGIMPGHAPLLSDLKQGPVRLVREDGEEEVYYLSGGYLEVQANSIAILADTAVRAGDIDEAAAAAALQYMCFVLFVLLSRFRVSKLVPKFDTKIIDEINSNEKIKTE